MGMDQGKLRVPLLLPDAPARDAAIRDALSAATGAGFDYRLIQNAATFRGLPTGPAMGMLALYQEAVERKITGGGA